MNIENFKADIIRRITEIDDESFLKVLSVIVDSGNSNLSLELTREQIVEIASSRKDIEKGLYIENNLLEKGVKIWLKRR